MTHRITAFASALLTACALMSCGSIAGDGGQSGTGISAVRGNVIGAAGTNLDVAGIRVILTEPEIETQTDADGHFELRGNASGPTELRFERASDGLSARTDVVIPAGGVLELADVELDPESDEAHPTMRRVEFEGLIDTLDCAGGAIRVTAKEDESGTIFTVQTASATIRDDAMPLQCADLQVGDRVEIDAETPDGLILVNAEVVLEDREDEPADDENGEDDPDRGVVDEPDGDNGDEADNQEGVDEPDGDNGDEADNQEGMDEPDGDIGDETDNQEGMDEPDGDIGDETDNQEGMDEPDGDNGDETDNQEGMDEPDGDNGDEADNQEGMDEPDGDNGDEADNQEGMDEPDGDNGDETDNQEGMDEPDGDNGDEADNQEGMDEPDGDNGDESHI